MSDLGRQKLICTNIHSEAAAEENQTAYFPLLDRIAEGHFTGVLTDKELHEKFLATLKEDGHVTDPVTLSSFQLALSLRSAAPRIQAHYQFYRTAVEPVIANRSPEECPQWVHFVGKQYCSPALSEATQEISAER